MNDPFILATADLDTLRRNVPFEVWLRRVGELTNTAPRATGAIFSWCPTTATCQVEPRVLVAQFGDGYAQRRPDGINTQDQIWSLEFHNRTQAVAEAIEAFLVARKGVDVFNWTPPRRSVVLDVICPDWSLSYGDLLMGGGRTMHVSARFQQVHQ
jgi:phage-related protein